MLRCPPFRYVAPTSLGEAAALLSDEPGAKLLAGGTDLVPGIKRGTEQPALLVSLRGVRELAGMNVDPRGARLGAMTTIQAIAAAPSLGAWSALGRAATQVATPHIRNTATLGGNLCLDTRCNYFDQSYEWRRAVGFCTKLGHAPDRQPHRPNADGTCWVAPGGDRCWAVSSTDLAPVLVALGAEVRLVSVAGERTIPLSDLYRDDGVAHLIKRRDEILADVRLGDPTGWRSTYWKLRRRQAFDFPVLSVAAALKVERGVVTDARLVLGAVGSRPVVVPETVRLVGQPVSDARIDAVADEATRLAKPLDNADFSLGWRKAMTRHFVAGALRELRGDDPRSLGLAARRAAGLQSI